MDEIEIMSCIMSNTIFTISEEKELEEDYLTRLKNKPNDQTIILGIALFYFYTEQYLKSLNYMKQIKEKKYIYKYLESVCNIKVNYLLKKHNNNLNLSKLDKACTFYEELFELIEDKYVQRRFEAAILYEKYSIEINNALNSYNMLHKLLMYLNKYKDMRYEIDMVYHELYSISLNQLKRPKEALEYLDEIKEFDVHFINSNKALCYFELNEFDKSIQILENEVKENPNNTDYYNLAKSYYMIENYSEALKNINKARFFFEDETSYTLAASINRKLNNIDDSIDLSKKALFFFENEELNFSTEKDNVNSYSCFNVDLTEKTYELIYNELFLCYLYAKKYEEAYGICEIALSKYKYNEKIRSNKEMIDKIIDINEENNSIMKKIELLKKEKENYKIKSKQAREWVVDLIKCQNKNKEINDLQIDLWERYDIQIQEIIRKMKNESNEEKNDYKNICKRMRKKFNNISIKALDCLSTAEYLYECNKDEFIDFAPIVIEYSKVFEIELNKVLKKILNKQGLTLGQILNNRQFRDNILLGKVFDYIEIIRDMRNESAHTGQLNIKNVDSIRKMIFENNVLNIILSLK